MSWVAITQTTVRAYADSRRLDVLWRDHATGEEQSWFEDVRNAVVARIRTKVGQHAALSQDRAKIPPEFAELGALLCLSAMLSRLGAVSAGANGGVFTLTEEQRTRIERLERDLEQVAEGKLSVTTPEDPDTTPDITGVSVEAVLPSPRMFTRTSTAGL